MTGFVCALWVNMFYSLHHWQNVNQSGAFNFTSTKSIPLHTQN